MTDRASAEAGDPGSGRDPPAPGSAAAEDAVRFTDLTDAPIIDAHVHVFPQAGFDALWAWFTQFAWPIHHRAGPDEILPYLFGRGLAGAVLLPYVHKPGLADGLNRFVAGLCRGRTDVRAFAAVHPRDVRPERILARAFDELGLIGCKLHVHVLRLPIDDPSFAPIFEACLEHDRWVNVHAGRQPSLASAYGMDVASISGVDRVQRVLSRYPDLKLVIPHFGIDQADEFFDLLDHYPNLYLDTAMVLADYFPFTIDPDRLVRYSHRIMYGSDFPNIPYDVTREAARIVALELGPTATAHILGATARRLFFS